MDDSDAGAASQMLARAFIDDALVRHVLPDERTREQRLARLYAVYLGFFRRHGLCQTNAERTAAALWAPPGTYPPSLAQHLRLLPGIARALGWRRVPHALRVLDRLERVHPVGRPHWYLCVLGVEPASQRRGIGRALLAPVLAQCDTDGLGAYLETGNEANLAFYAREGFAVLHEDRLPGGPPFWGLWREPRPLRPAAGAPVVHKPGVGGSRSLSNGVSAAHLLQMAYSLAGFVSSVQKLHP